jgi:hypothetical protein
MRTAVPTAVLEVHFGADASVVKYHSVIETAQGGTELIEVPKPSGLRVGFCSYLGPKVTQ